jgi:drug/metabolite transporter (DMT)-like permease
MMNKSYNVVSTNTLKAFFNGIMLLITGIIFFQLNFTRNLLLWSLILGIIHAFGTIIYFTALTRKNVGEIIPFYQSAGILFIFISSVLVFNEIVTSFNFAGIVLILVGVYLVLSEKFLKIPPVGKASLLILLLIPLDITHALLVKNLLFNIKPINLSIATYFSATLLLASYQLVSNKHSFEKLSIIKPRLPKILCASFFGAFGTLFLYTALFFGNASKVYPMAGLTSIFIFIIASIFLREKFYWHRLLGIVVAFLGIYLIS